ncbi:angiopoietin-1 receptor-like [Ptychodera flava]|uniref:angiopoietin-1 receptor-like n=1 Tax=Ptychodera flava TaxID=63121 RepID=UPI00396A7FD0
MAMKRILEQMSLSTLASNFEAERIDPTLVPSMSEGQLMRLGVGTMGLQLRLKQLCQAYIQAETQESEGDAAAGTSMTALNFTSGASVNRGRLDVTFFNGKATPSFSGNLFIAGFSAGDAISTVGTSFTFSRILDTGTGPNLPLQRYENLGGYERRLYLSSGVDRPGVYYCDANANTGETERLQTVLVAEEAEIRPESQTKTVSWGDDVTLTMTTTISEASLKWRHNGIEKPEWNGQSSITISFAKTSDAGIYECYSSETQRSQGKNGFMRLIVRGCPNGKWGLPDCLFPCPTCYNGGMCNSDTGECICPPGFQGTDCETGCGKNNWGMTCERRCSSSNPDACRRTMYCIADPYGCSCSASYGGIDCTTGK